MENKNKLAHSLSLMERMENKGSYDEGMLIEKRIIAEAERATDVNTFIDFLTKYQVHRGPFVSLAYIQIYPTNALYPSDGLHNTMSGMRNDFEEGSRGVNKFDKFMDRVSNTEWSNPTGRAYKGSKSFGTKLYPYILKLTRYRIHWQDEETYNKKYSELNKPINDLKNRMTPETRDVLGIRDMSPEEIENRKNADSYRYIGDLKNYDIATFAHKGDDGEWSPTRHEYLSDVNDENSVVNYNRNVIKNIMPSSKSPSSQRPLYFGVNEDGSLDMIPKSLGELLYRAGSTSKDISVIQDKEQYDIAKQYQELTNNRAILTKEFILHNVAYICGLVSSYGQNKESKYFVNPNPIFLLDKTSKGKKIKYLYNNINQDELYNILERYAKIESETIENHNVDGQTLYADDEYTEE